MTDSTKTSAPPKATRGSEPTQRRLESIAVAAEYANISTRSVRRYISQGRLTGYRVGIRLIRVDLNEVDERILRRIPTAEGTTSPTNSHSRAEDEPGRDAAPATPSGTKESERMSRSLYWRPVPKDPPPYDVPEDVETVLRRRYWEDDGLPRSESAELDSRDVPWLEGLRDAGLSGATELIAAIREHGTIRLTWEG